MNKLYEILDNLVSVCAGFAFVGLTALIWALFYMVAFAPRCEAQMLTVVHVQAPGAVPDKNVKGIYSRDSWYFSQFGVTFRHRIIKASSECQEFHTLNTRGEEVSCFMRQAVNTGILDPDSKRVHLVYFMTEPFYYPWDSEKLLPLIGGIAIAIGGKVATGNALVRTPFDEPRANHSANILAHEICHLMTCTHIADRVNLMHPNANDFTFVYRNRLPVALRTKRQIKRWAKTLGVRI